MKYHTLFFRKLEKMSQNLSSTAVVIGALRVNIIIQTCIHVLTICLAAMNNCVVC